MASTLLAASSPVLDGPDRLDALVVGGGIVGLATAVAIADEGRFRVAVLEGEDRIGTHQTGHNSGVIHSGLYYRPGSLKAELCRSGREAMYAFCAEHGIPHRRTGKLVVATTREQVPSLDALEARGRANGLTGLRRLGPAELIELEPNARGEAALWVEETGVVDFSRVAAALAQRVRDGGGQVFTGARVVRVATRGDAVIAETTNGTVRGSLLVNCAGLQSDRVARLCGIVPDVRIVPFRGEYCELVPERRDIVRHHIYPVPDPDLPFLGVHFTRLLDGRVKVGPNAVLAFKREGYSRRSVDLRDVVDTMSFPGFWRLARSYWKTGLGELLRSASKQRFARAAMELVPSLSAADLRIGPTGVRAQAVDRRGRLLDDFHILEAKRSIHVLNAPSPAATASLSIGRAVAMRAHERLAH